MKINKKILYRVFYSFFFVVLNFIMLITGMLATIDNFFMDSLYQKRKTINPDIKIIAIDDKSIEELGNSKYMIHMMI